MCTGCQRTTAPLPPRKDDRHRRSGCLRRRDRPHGRERRPLRRKRSHRPGGDRVARRHRQARRACCRRRRKALPHALARGDGRDPRLPNPATTAGDVRAQIVRTVPEGVYDAVLESATSGSSSRTVAALSQARDFIYLENQFLWSPEIIEILREKLRRPPNDRFRILLVLPVKPADGHRRHAWRARGAGGSRWGRGTISRLHAVCATGALTDPIYVQQSGVVDDTWLTVGSANLNEHSLFNDTEMNVVTHDRRLARETRIRLWADTSSPRPRAWGRPVERDRPPLEGDQSRSTRSTRVAPTAHTPRRPTTGRLNTVGTVARTVAGSGRRRLSAGCRARTQSSASIRACPGARPPERGDPGPRPRQRDRLQTRGAPRLHSLRRGRRALGRRRRPSSS